MYDNLTLKTHRLHSTLHVLSSTHAMRSPSLPSTVLPLVTLACFSVFVWQLYLIVEEYIHPQES